MLWKLVGLKVIEAIEDNMGITYDSNIEWYLFLLNFVKIGGVESSEPMQVIWCLLRYYFSFRTESKVG